MYAASHHNVHACTNIHCHVSTVMCSAHACMTSTCMLHLVSHYVCAHAFISVYCCITVCICRYTCVYNLHCHAEWVQEWLRAYKCMKPRRRREQQENKNEKEWTKMHAQEAWKKVNTRMHMHICTQSYIHLSKVTPVAMCAHGCTHWYTDRHMHAPPCTHAPLRHTHTHTHTLSKLPLT